MAAVTYKAFTGSSANATSYAASSMTPAAGDLILVLVTAPGTVVALPTISDTQNLGWTFIGSALGNSSVDTCYAFISSKPAAASATTITFDCTGDAATGCGIQIFTLQSMTRFGINAVRQWKNQNNGAAAGTPAPVFAVAALTTSICFGLLQNVSAPATVTPPASWIEDADSNSTTPTCGSEVCHITTGFTGTTVTWGSTSATAFAALIIEIDATATDQNDYDSHVMAGNMRGVMRGAR